MRRMHTQIGEVKLFAFKMANKEWNRRELSNTLMDNIGAYAGGEAELTKGMGVFYMKIRGYRDESIIPEDLYCYACPRNSNYRMYDDYSGLREENKQPVLVLKSNFIDFREYSIVGSYYTDGPQEGDNFDDVEIWADRSSIRKWFKKKMGL